MRACWRCHTCRELSVLCVSLSQLLVQFTHQLLFRVCCDSVCVRTSNGHADGDCCRRCCSCPSHALSQSTTQIKPQNMYFNISRHSRNAVRATNAPAHAQAPSRLQLPNIVPLTVQCVAQPLTRSSCHLPVATVNTHTARMLLWCVLSPIYKTYQCCSNTHHIASTGIAQRL